MKLRLLFSIAAVAIIALLARRYMRLDGDLIFHSDDIVSFTLPNGKPVLTNQWYEQVDLLKPGQEFFVSPNGLGISKPLVIGFALTEAGEGPQKFLRVSRTNPAVLDVERSSQHVHEEGKGLPQVQEVKEGVVDEYWVSRAEKGPGE